MALLWAPSNSSGLGLGSAGEQGRFAILLRFSEELMQIADNTRCGDQVVTATVAVAMAFWSYNAQTGTTKTSSPRA